MALNENEKTVEQGTFEEFKKRSAFRVSEIMHEPDYIHGEQVCTKTMILQLLDMALNDIVPVNTGGIDSFYSAFDKDVWKAMRDLLKHHGIQNLRQNWQHQGDMIVGYSCKCGYEKSSTMRLNCSICNTRMNIPVITYNQKDSEVDDSSDHSPILEYMRDRFSTDSH